MDVDAANLVACLGQIRPLRQMTEVAPTLSESWRSRTVLSQYGDRVRCVATNAAVMILHTSCLSDVADGDRLEAKHFADPSGFDVRDLADDPAALGRMVSF
jgi:hypothetical protein